MSYIGSHDGHLSNEADLILLFLFCSIYVFTLDLDILFTKDYLFFMRSITFIDPTFYDHEI